SGTTGIAKKLLLDSTSEDLRNEWRARFYLFCKKTKNFLDCKLWGGGGAENPPPPLPAPRGPPPFPPHPFPTFLHPPTLCKMESGRRKKLVQAVGEVRPAASRLRAVCRFGILLNHTGRRAD